MGNPLYSIVITFHKHEQFLIYCITALLPTIPENTEIIIIGEGLSSPSLKRSLTDSRIKLISLDSAIPYPAAINKSVEYSRGSTLIFLDQDTVPTKGWFKALTDFKKKNKSKSEIGVLSSKILDPQTGLIIDFVIVFTKYNAPHPWRGCKPDFPLCQNSYKTQAACSAAMMVDKKVFELVGGMDQDQPYSYCDIDFCLRVKDKGYETWVVSDALIYHYNGIPKSGQKHLKEDTKGQFFGKNYSRIRLDMEHYFNLNWSFFIENNQVEPQYFLINMMTVIDKKWYEDLIESTLRIEVLDQINVSILERDSTRIDLYKTLSWPTMRKKLPLLFLVDYSVSLKENELWHSSRDCQNDLVIDRNGNICMFRDL